MEQRVDAGTISSLNCSGSTSLSGTSLLGQVRIAFLPFSCPCLCQQALSSKRAFQLFLSFYRLPTSARQCQSGSKGFIISSVVSTSHRLE